MGGEVIVKLGRDGRSAAHDDMARPARGDDEPLLTRGERFGGQWRSPVAGSV